MILIDRSLHIFNIIEISEKDAKKYDKEKTLKQFHGIHQKLIQS